MLLRYKIFIQYDGNFLNGWHGDNNSLKNQVFISDLLLKAIFKLTSEKTQIYCAGRTDSGVHATKQVCHFDLNKEISIETVIHGLNFYLPVFIRVINAEIVDENFHARFSAKTRVYEYLIYNSQVISPLWHNRAYLVRKKLNIEKMQKSINVFLNCKDISTLCPNKYTGKKDRTISSMEITPFFIDCMISIKISAKSFAHHQVRNMIGCTIMMGQNKWSACDLEDRLNQKDRIYGATMAPACGLYLIDVIY